MKIKPYLTKLNDSQTFKNFSKEYNDAFVVAGFFVLDFESKKNMHQIDYYVPSKKKIAAFNLDEKVNMQMLDMLNSKVPEKLDMNTQIDLDQLYGILEDEMKNRSITADIKKIIAIIQNIDGKRIWNLSCILSGMGLVNAHVEDSSRTVLKMEKHSLMDLIKRVNPADLKAQLNGGGAAPQDGAQPQVQVLGGAKPGVKPTKKDIAMQIKRLDALEGALEKEKEALRKEEAKISKVASKVKSNSSKSKKK